MEACEAEGQGKTGGEMNTTNDKGRKLASDDYREFAESLAPRIVELLDRAKRGEFAPPFEVEVTDGRGDLVFRAEVDATGAAVHCTSLTEDRPLNAHYPLTVVLSEGGGGVWTGQVEAPSIQ
jgi:hypothetical protein